MAALFTLAKIQKKPNRPPVDKWIKKMCVFLSHKKKKKILPFAVVWMDLEASSYDEKDIFLAC